jgi:hypothetical protein
MVPQESQRSDSGNCRVHACSATCKKTIEVYFRIRMMSRHCGTVEFEYPKFLVRRMMTYDDTDHPERDKKSLAFGIRVSD